MDLPFNGRSSLACPPAPGYALDDPSAAPFDERACFIAGPARSGTTLLAALLDGHPELLVLPEETAYFPTVLARLGARPRPEQVEYLIARSLSNVLFGGACKWGKRDYSHFASAQLRRRFEAAAYDPANSRRDLLVVLLETYAAVLGRSLDSVRRWVEKTPANRNHLAAIWERFPTAKVLLTIRDPRALLASQIQLEASRRLRQFSAYLTARHWLTTAQLALRHRQTPAAEGGDRLRVIRFDRLASQPRDTMREVCAFLGIGDDPALLEPTKIGRPWTGNSSAQNAFTAVSTEPIDRWRTLLTEAEIGWIEWHCREPMEALGYEPLLARRRLGHWARPVRGETPREYIKSRWYSLGGGR